MYGMSIFAERFKLLVALFTFCITSLNLANGKNLKKILFISIFNTSLFLKGVEMPSQPLRIWTSTFGSTLEAKIVDILKKEYVLEKPNKDRIKVPRGTLSEKDMVYLDWLEARSANIPQLAQFGRDYGYDISNPNHMDRFDLKKLKANTSLGKYSRKDGGFFS